MRKRTSDHKRNIQEKKNYFPPIDMFESLLCIQKTDKRLLQRMGIDIVLDVNNTNNECKHEKDGWKPERVSERCRQVSRNRRTHFTVEKMAWGGGGSLTSFFLCAARGT